MNGEIKKRLEELILKALEKENRLPQLQVLMDLRLTVARIKTMEK